jgi:hypothetical protein
MLKLEQVMQEDGPKCPECPINHISRIGPMVMDYGKVYSLFFHQPFDADFDGDALGL